MTTSIDEFHLHLEDHTCITNANLTNNMTLSSPNSGPASPIHVLTILTPKFYSAAVAHHSLATFLSSALLPGIIEDRMAITKATDPQTIIELVKHAEDRSSLIISNVFSSNTNTVVAQRFGYKTPTCVILQSLLSLVWSCMTLVRHRLLTSSSVGGLNARSSVIAKRLKVIAGGDSGICSDIASEHANGLDNSALGCFLDGFVRENYGAAQQIRYLAAGLMAVIRERILNIVGGG